jgi:hypothetical protein
MFSAGAGAAVVSPRGGSRYKSWQSNDSQMAGPPGILNRTLTSC